MIIDAIKLHLERSAAVKAKARRRMRDAAAEAAR